MMRYYQEFFDTICLTPTINTHSHHRPDDYFHECNLDLILRSSYVDWCGVSFDESPASREAFLDKVRYKSFFVFLEKSIMEIYGITEKLSADNWDHYNEVISEKYTDPDWHLNLLKDPCRYEKIILDTPWAPGSDNGHPDLFVPTLRIDSLFLAYDKTVRNHDDANAFIDYGREFSSVDEVVAFASDLIADHIRSGGCAVKNAEAYDRPVRYEPVSKEAANAAFTKTVPSEADIRNFQDYLFDQICGMAADADVPVQIHTGLGQLCDTRAIHLLGLIRRHPGTKFSLMHGSFPWCSDILAFLDLFRNVYADTVWLAPLSPTAGTIMLHQLIEAGTSDKVFWGCDTWTSEESWGAKTVMAQVLAKALSEKVESGYFGKKDALALIQKYMHDNACGLFKL